MIVKKYGVDFFNEGGNNALTLQISEVSEFPNGLLEGNTYERTHPDGWTIKGEIVEDYYQWVNTFEANHPTFGKVWGDFEKEVYSSSEEGFNHFMKKHPPMSWDYRDI